MLRILYNGALQGNIVFLRQEFFWQGDVSTNADLQVFLEDTQMGWDSSFAGFLLNLAVSGILLLGKKNFAWIQPPTMAGTEGAAGDFIDTQELFEIVFRQGNADFRDMEDIERVDFRPAKRVFKVRSKHNYAEMQVDAISGGILSVAGRPSDLLEAVHDGSYYAGWLHATLMPVAGGGLIFVSLSGLYLWVAAWMRKRRQKRK
jgi:hypothetical protein